MGGLPLLPFWIIQPLIPVCVAMRDPVNRNCLDVSFMIEAMPAKHPLKLFTDLLLVIIECGRVDFMTPHTQKITSCSLGSIGGRGGSHHEYHHGIIGSPWWFVTS